MSDDQANENFNEKQPSWVKTHFVTYVEASGVKRRRCLASGCDHSFTAKISTNHLKDHWKRDHSNEDPMPPRNLRLHHQDWNHYLILFIVKARKEFSLVENEYFLKFASSMSSCKKIIGRKELSERIKCSCEDLKRVVKDTLKESVSVALTFDVWTANRSCRSFAAITAHYISENMTLKSFLLEFKRLKYPHDTASLKEFLAVAIREFELEDKIITITGDNASVNTSALRELSRDMSLGTKFGFGDIQMRCIAHVINLAVKSGLEKLKTTLEPIRRVVNIINGSPKRRERFEAIQEEIVESLSSSQSELYFKKPHQLVEEVDTRWNSTFLMLERFAMLRPAIEEAIRQMAELRDTEIEWDVITLLNKYLSPYYDLTKRISGSKYSTISFVRTSLPLIIRHTIKFEGDEIIGSSAIALNQKLAAYSSILDSDIAEISTILDPRFKLACFQPEAHEELQAKLRHYASQLGQDPILSNCSQSSRSHESSMFDELFLPKEQDDVARYCSEPRVHDTTDVLSWWFANISTYPNLYKLARVILCVQPTSVASEQTFSLAGLVDNPRRANLSDRSFESCLLVSSWYDLLK